MKKVIVMLVMLAVAGGALAAAAIRPLTMQEMARYGATDALVFGASDFTESTDNTAQTNTFTLSGPCVYEYVAVQVDVPFDSTFTTNTLSSTLTFNAGSTALISDLQIANDATRPYKFSRYTPTATTTVTPTTTVITNVVGDVTNLYTVAVAANTATTALVTPYIGIVTNGGTATLTTIITGPDASTSLEDVDIGALRIFLRILR